MPSTWSDVATHKVTFGELVDTGKLIPLSQLREILGATEPIQSITVHTGQDMMAFKVEPLWNDGLADKTGTSPVEARLVFGSADQDILANTGYGFTVDSFLEATSLVGLPKGYTGRCPAQLVEGALNYWYGGGMSRDIKLLLLGKTIGGMSRGTIEPFSNLAILDAICERLEANGIDTDLAVYADAKVHHDLLRTDFRLVLDDGLGLRVPSARDSAAHPDMYSVGIAVSNSLIGATQTSVEGYLFSWLTCAGAIDRQHASGMWSRRVAGQTIDDVAAWAGARTESILAGIGKFPTQAGLTFTPLLGTFELVADLVNAGMDSGEAEISGTLQDVFANYAVPPAARQHIIAAMVDTDDLTMYGVMQAVSTAANCPELTAKHVDAVMAVAGEIPHVVGARCPECHRLRL